MPHYRKYFDYADRWTDSRLKCSRRTWLVGGSTSGHKSWSAPLFRADLTPLSENHESLPDDEEDAIGMIERSYRSVILEVAPDPQKAACRELRRFIDDAESLFRNGRTKPRSWRGISRSNARVQILDAANCARPTPFCRKPTY